MNAKDSHEENNAFMKTMPTTMQSQQRTQVPLRTQMMQQYRNLDIDNQNYGYDDEEEEEPEEEEQDPYAYKVSFVDKKEDDATKRYQEKKKQMLAKRE